MRDRILAVLGALALVALAVFVRGKLVDDADGGKEGSRPAAERPVVACTPDLAAICTALADAGGIAEDPPTLDLNTAANPPKEIEGWITWAPGPAIANLDDTASGGDTVWSKDVVLGSAELGVLAVPSPLGCTQPLEWTCLAQNAGLATSIGVGTVTSAEGLARLAPLAPVLAPSGDLRDVDVERGREILDGPTAGQDDAPSMLRDAFKPGSVDAVVASLPAAQREARAPQAQTRALRAIPGKPAVRAAVVLTSRSPDLGAVAAAAKTGKPADELSALGLAPGGSGPSIDPAALWQLRKRLR